MEAGSQEGMAVRVSCTADQRESVGAVRVGCALVPV